LHLTEDEQHALLAFLESLSGRVLEGVIRLQSPIAGGTIMKPGPFAPFSLALAPVEVVYVQNFLEE
jgi:hypothetical protein